MTETKHKKKIRIYDYLETVRKFERFEDKLRYIVENIKKHPEAQIMKNIVRVAFCRSFDSIIRPIESAEPSSASENLCLFTQLLEIAIENETVRRVLLRTFQIADETLLLNKDRYV